MSEQCGGLAVVAVEVLTGGRSHSNHAITLGEPGGRCVVLRTWVRPEWRERDPDFTVEREVAALVLLERAGFAAPRLVAADPRGDRGGKPALLMTRVAGQPPSGQVAPSVECLDQLASAARNLHRIAAPWPDIPNYRPYHDLRDPRPPRLSVRSEPWERAFSVLAGAPPRDREVFIHRDYHPGNTLWLGDTLTGVVDWTTASRGPVGVDLGHMRWNLVLDHGEEVADAFLASYRESSEERHELQPYWDLRCLIDLLPDDGHDDGLTGAQLSRLEPYLSRLLARC